ncbi:hypothetical protein D3Y57_19140 [Sphingomonas paeninsulae]|uniref:Uncharacterized protein n=1 Tax=Sphingomonas paeninsulae TaxID=2319844 RepID=A0A494TP65_SPHPE|nr:hypothetical protein [Sphingomonas paeninsulae]AYJ87651.1 hypothetical protein D3Y57_19140 [Sphingomonas paeninsulae]
MKERPTPVRPYALRPCPPDFRERYMLGGWEEVELEYGSRPSVITRWIEENGGDELRYARSEHLKAMRAEASVARLQRRRVG